MTVPGTDMMYEEGGEMSLGRGRECLVSRYVTVPGTDMSQYSRYVTEPGTDGLSLLLF